MTDAEIAQRFVKDGIEIVRSTRQSRRGVSSVTYMKRPDDIATYVERRYKLGDRTLRIEAVCQEGRPLIGEIATSYDIGRRCWWAEAAGD